MTWVDFQDPTNTATKQALSKILELPLVDQQLLIGQIVALNARAANGNVPFGDDRILRPIRVDPDIYELKWSHGGLLFRQYHGEPKSLPDTLIQLHFHEKDVSSGNDTIIEHLQDLQISQARLRYSAGETNSWGLN